MVQWTVQWYLKAMAGRNVQSQACMPGLKCCESNSLVNLAPKSTSLQRALRDATQQQAVRGGGTTRYQPSSDSRSLHILVVSMAQTQCPDATTHKSAAAQGTSSECCDHCHSTTCSRVHAIKSVSSKCCDHCHSTACSKYTRRASWKLRPVKG